MTRLATPAWQLKGVTGSRAGVLALEDGRLSFVTREGVMFDAPASAVSATFPFHYLGGGMKLEIDGERYRFSFLKPNAAENVPAELVDAPFRESRRGRVADAVGALTVDFEGASFQRGRKAGKAWKAALAGAAPLA